MEKVIDIEVIQSPLFQRQKKRLHKNQIRKLDSQIRDIIKDPDIGEDKKGALKGVRVHKFHAGKQLLLLAYEVADENLQLIMTGSHENFYRDLQKYIQNPIDALILLRIYIIAYINYNMAHVHKCRCPK